MGHLRERSLLLAFGWMTLAGSVPAQSFRFLPESIESVWDVSQDGEVLVGGLHDGGAYRWGRGDGLTELESLGGPEVSLAQFTNADGSIVYGYSYDASIVPQAVRWNDAGEVRVFVDGGATIVGCSDGGQRVAGRFFDPESGDSSFVMKNGSPLRMLGSLGGGDDHATCCSSDGKVVFGIADDAKGHPRFFRWTPAGGMRNLGGFPLFCNACSDDGTTVVGMSHDEDGDLRGVRWTEATGVQVLGSLGYEQENATHCSADGSVVAGYAHLSSREHRAFRWTEEIGMTDLGSFGMRFSEVDSMSADGDVIGGHAHARDEVEAFLWRSGIGTKRVSAVLSPVFEDEIAGWDIRRIDRMSDDGRTFVLRCKPPTGKVRFAWVRLPRQKNVSEERAATRFVAAALAQTLTRAAVAYELDPADPAALASYAYASQAYGHDAEARRAAADVDDAGEAFGAFYAARAKSYAASVCAEACGGAGDGRAATLLKHDLEN